MRKLLLLVFVFGIVLSSYVYAIPDKFGRGLEQPTDNIVFYEVKEISPLQALFSSFGLFTLYGLQSSYQAGQELMVTANQEFLSGKPLCQGAAYLVMELYKAPVGQQTSQTYIGGNAVFLGNDLISGKHYQESLKATIPNNAQSGTWSISSYFYCPSKNPSPATDYSSVDENNFNVVGTSTCTNECSSSQTICTGYGGYVNRYVASCGNYDVDSCLEYQVSQPFSKDCGAAYSCTNGVCISSCTNGALNPPTCNICSEGHVLQNNQCIIKQETCNKYKIENNQCMATTDCNAPYSDLASCQNALSGDGGGTIDCGKYNNLLGISENNDACLLAGCDLEPYLYAWQRCITKKGGGGGGIPTNETQPSTEIAQLPLTEDEWSTATPQAVLASSCISPTECSKDRVQTDGEFDPNLYRINCFSDTEVVNANKDAFNKAKPDYCSSIIVIPISGISRLILGKDYICNAKDPPTGTCRISLKEGAGFSQFFSWAPKLGLSKDPVQDRTLSGMLILIGGIFIIGWVLKKS